MDTNIESKELGRASYTEAERRELIAEFKASELSQAAFCREWNLNPKTFGRWLRSERETQAVSFCKVEVQQPRPSERSVRVCFANRIEMSIALQSMDELSDLFRAAVQC